MFTIKPEVVVLVAHRKNIHGEWLVRLTIGGKIVKDADYFTTDHDDAVKTAASMLAKAKAD